MSEIEFQRAMGLHQSGQLHEAEEIYRKLITLNPKYEPALSKLGNVLLGLGRTQEAVQILAQAHDLKPSNTETLSSLGSSHAQLGNMEMGLAFVRKAVDGDSMNVNARFLLANLLLHAGQQEDALEAFYQTLEINPKIAEAHYNVGSILYSNGKIDDSVHAFIRAVEHSPDLVAAHSNLGHIYANRGDYEQARVSLEKALKLDANHGLAHKNMGMVLHTTGDLNQALNHYHKAMKILGNDVEVHVLLGNLHRDRSELDLAKKQYELALDLDPKNEIAKLNLKKMSASRIAAWHFDMLADGSRNDAYDSALKAAVQKGDTVLDIGTGSGLLAMMAVRAGASKVTACELVPVLADVAIKVVKDNGLEHQINVIQKKSNALVIGEDMPEKADVLVSEILDTAIVGEGVIPSLRHALQNLVKPGAKVIPAGADFRAVLIETKEHHRVHPVRDISGFDLSAFNVFRTEDVYQRIQLNLLAHTKLSEIFPMKSYDFASLPPVTPDTDPEVVEMKVSINKSGMVNGVVFWFNLRMNEKLTLSTGPDGEMVHWGQAAYMFKEPKMVTAGETFVLQVWYSDTLIRFRI